MRNSTSLKVPVNQVVNTISPPVLREALLPVLGVSRPGEGSLWTIYPCVQTGQCWHTLGRNMK